MSEMVTRATEAAMAEVKRQIGGQQIPGTPDERFWSGEGDMQSLDFALIVRAAIQALREPTAAMITVGERDGIYASVEHERWSREVAKKAYQAMIDSCLQD